MKPASSRTVARYVVGVAIFVGAQNIAPHFSNQTVAAAQSSSVQSSTQRLSNPLNDLLDEAQRDIDKNDFEAAILAGKLLKPATQEMMLTSERTADGKSTSYALGWGVTDKIGVHIVGHDGGQQGTSTAILIAPQKFAGIVVLANMDSLDSNQLAEGLLKIMLDLPNRNP